MSQESSQSEVEEDENAQIDDPVTEIVSCTENNENAEVDKAILQLEEEIISKLDDNTASCSKKGSSSRNPVKQKYRKAWEQLPALKGIFSNSWLEHEGLIPKSGTIS